MPKPILEAQFNAIIKPLEKYEQEFPTVIELLKILRDELTEDEFSFYKLEMIKALYFRMDKKFRCLDDLKYYKKNNVEHLITPEVEQMINKEYRVFISRIDKNKILKFDKAEFEEILDICGASFTLRDLRLRFWVSDGKKQYEEGGLNLNTTQLYKELDKVALQIGTIPYED